MMITSKSGRNSKNFSEREIMTDVYRSNHFKKLNMVEIAPSGKNKKYLQSLKKIKVIIELKPENT